MKRVMGLLDKNEEGDGIIRWDWRGWWAYLDTATQGVMGLLDKNDEGAGITSIRWVGDYLIR